MFFSAIFISVLGYTACTVVEVTVPVGSGSVILPCHSVKGNIALQIRSLVWWRIHGETNETIALWKSNVTDTVKLAEGYDFRDDRDLLIYNPDEGSAGNYVCEVTWNSKTTVQSEIELLVSDQEKLDEPFMLHHYLVAAIIVVLVFIEATFILVLWGKLRKKKPKERPPHSCFGPLSFDNDIIAHGGVERLRGDNRVGNGQRLLLDDLNDAPFPDGDSGFGDRDSVEAVV